jgi:hypothetical protein
MPLPRLSFSCECFYVALVAGQEKGIGKTFIQLLILDTMKNACVGIESNHIVVITLLIDFPKLI